MDKEKLSILASNFIEASEENYVTKELAISEEVVGMKIFDSPILGFGNATDETFTLLKNPGVIGSHFKLPEDWLPGSKTVVSFFLPFTDMVKNGNAKEKTWPSPEWLHGRIEGQAVVNKLSRYLQSTLIEEGFTSIVPIHDEGFWSREHPVSDSSKNQTGEHPVSFTSNWSERHVAFVCGLGTFSLSKGLITKKGVAGRFGSIITTLELEGDKREYTDIYQNCSMCGACISQCPVQAISLENGKNHPICCDFLYSTAKKYKPRYGCGKCQVNVPCQGCIPGR